MNYFVLDNNFHRIFLWDSQVKSDHICQGLTVVFSFEMCSCYGVNLTISNVITEHLLTMAVLLID